jgi:iron complex transport system permease protein
VAASVGVHVKRLRVETFAVAAAVTAAAVALAGPVGFVGLIVPHVCRLLLGPDHRRLAVWCGGVGAIFLMLADTLCRTAGEWIAVGQVPVGVITALVGGPFFIVLLRRRSREGQL